MKSFKPLSNHYVQVGAEGYNPFGWKLTWVYSMIKFAYDDIANQFVLDYSEARNWAGKVWWCFTCDAKIVDTITQMTLYRLYDRASWQMGSWNAKYTGYNEIEIKTTSTRNYLYVSYWVRIDGEGTFGNALNQWIPIIIQLIPQTSG